MLSKAKFRIAGKNPKPILLSAVVIALFAVVSISGCNKPDDNTTSCTDGLKNGTETGVDCGGSCTACTAKQFLVKTKTFVGGGDSYTETYTYDDRGRITSVTSVSTLGSLTTTYTYSGSAITVNDGANTSTITLNSQGYAVSRTLSWGTITYTYDADWHLLSSSDGLSYTWSAGNMTSASSPTTTYTDTYLTNKFNTTGNENFGQTFLGKSSINLVDAYILVNNGSVYTYTYQYDSQNRVIQADDGTAVLTYTYY